MSKLNKSLNFHSLSLGLVGISQLKSVLCLGMLTLLLSACDNRISLAEEKMAEIRRSPSQPIQLPPKPEKVEDFVYSAGKERSPFMPPNLLVSSNQVMDSSGVQPDLTRSKEELESYSLSELVYRGVLVSPTGDQYGLVQRPDGSVASVRVGDHLGTDYGRIVEITATQINLIEIVPDNRSGFVERPASLVSPAG